MSCSEVAPGDGRATRLAAITLAVLAGVVLSSCSSSAPEVKPPDPAQRLATAKQRADAASSVHLLLTSRDVPPDAIGVLGAEGWGTRAPAFKGTFKARLKGVEGDAEVVAVDGGVWMKLPFAPAMIKTDVNTFGAPDPASLFSPTAGITSLLPATINPTSGESVREGSEVLSTISGTLPGQKVRDLLRTGDAGQPFEVRYGLTESGDLRKATVTGPFFPGTRSSYDVILDRYGEPVDIRRP